MKKDLYLSELRLQIVELFTIAEIQNICFDLGIDHEELGGASSPKSVLVRNLIAFCERTNKTDKLILLCKNLRPSKNWHHFISESPEKEKEGAIKPDVSQRKLRVFLSYGKPDYEKVLKLYDRLVSDGFLPWMDKKDLLGGQDWQLEIESAIRKSDVVIVCGSQRSVNRIGFVQYEIRHALQRSQEFPEGAIFLIPLKLELCELPNSLKKYHWIEYFLPDGYDRLHSSLIYCSRKLGIDLKTRLS